MDIYLDTCALNRLTDDPAQKRIREEADAVERILNLAFGGKLRWVASTVLQYELSLNPDPLRRLASLELVRSASEIIGPDAATRTAAQLLVGAGLKPIDALHLAICNQAKVNWLITTDDRFCRAAHRSPSKSSTEVANPVEWLQRRHLWLVP
jgi:predicted nucleic acid-binding protein